MPLYPNQVAQADLKEALLTNEVIMGRWRKALRKSCSCSVCGRTAHLFTSGNGGSGPFCSPACVSLACMDGDLLWAVREADSWAGEVALFDCLKWEASVICASDAKLAIATRRAAPWVDGLTLLGLFVPLDCDWDTGCARCSKCCSIERCADLRWDKTGERQYCRTCYGKHRRDDLVGAESRARQIREKYAGGYHTREQWAALLAACGGKCLACESTSDITKDHIEPLAKGGHHGIANIQPLCRKCNSRKGDKRVDYRPVSIARFASALANSAACR